MDMNTIALVDIDGIVAISLPETNGSRHRMQLQRPYARSLLNTVEPLEKAYHLTLRVLTRIWLTIHLETLRNLHIYPSICITVQKGRRSVHRFKFQVLIQAVGANNPL